MPSRNFFLLIRDPVRHGDLPHDPLFPYQRRDDELGLVQVDTDVLFRDPVQMADDADRSPVLGDAGGRGDHVLFAISHVSLPCHGIPPRRQKKIRHAAGPSSYLRAEGRARRAHSSSGTISLGENGAIIFRCRSRRCSSPASGSIPAGGTGRLARRILPHAVYNYPDMTGIVSWFGISDGHSFPPGYPQGNGLTGPGAFRSCARLPGHGDTLAPARVPGEVCCPQGRTSVNGPWRDSTAPGPVREGPRRGNSGGFVAKSGLPGKF